MADESFGTDFDHQAESDPQSGPNSVSAYAWLVIAATIVFLITSLIILFIHHRRKNWRRRTTKHMEQGNTTETTKVKPALLRPPVPPKC
jgi:heme/copper-type cytochrome/quinol oxidase subunit 2